MNFKMVDGQVEGPAEYMNDVAGFAACVAKINAGESAVFNYGGSVLVTLQTHYAGWRGMKQLEAQRAVARESQEKFVAEHKAARAKENAAARAARKGRS